jgi:hypothetical protein
MATISRLAVDQTLWSVERRKMGSTTISYNALYTVVITEIAADGQSVMARWNGNPPKRFHARSVSKWRVAKPEPKGTIMGMTTY